MINNTEDKNIVEVRRIPSEKEKGSSYHQAFWNWVHIHKLTEYSGFGLDNRYDDVRAYSDEGMVTIGSCNDYLILASNGEVRITHKAWIDARTSPIKGKRYKRYMIDEGQWWRR